MNDVRTEDLKTVSAVGNALWSDPHFSRQVTMETWSAVSLLETTPEKKLERAAAVLLDRAVREGAARNNYANLSALSAQPLFKLEPVERFVLASLHSAGRWSYKRIARVIDRTPEQVESLAWQARIVLAGHATITGIKIGYPSGGGMAGPNCPQYQSDRPWTQRFLDDELPNSRERMFLQNHLMACHSCRKALDRCRDFYYSVDTLISPLLESPEQARHLWRAFEEGAQLMTGEISFLGSLNTFFKRSEVKILLILFWAVLMAQFAFK